MKKLAHFIFNLSFILLTAQINAQPLIKVDSLPERQPTCEVIIQPPVSNILPNPVYPSAVVNCGKFRIVYDDLNANGGTGNGLGYDDPVLGATRRNCVCNVLTYMQSIIDFHPSISISNQITLYFKSVNNPSAGFLATATPSYSNATSMGFYHTDLADLIINGNTNISQNIDFGEMNTNFANDFSYCTTVGNCEVDFFTVILHEMTHLLGFASAIQVNGNAVVSNLGSQTFTKFDELFLYYDNGGVMEKLVDNGSTNFSSFATKNNIESSRIWMYNSNPAVDKTNQPMYAPIFYKPSALSHFDENFLLGCNHSPQFSPPYVMNFKGVFGIERKQYSNQELRWLQDMGFTLNNTQVPSVMVQNHPPQLNGAAVDGPIYIYTPGFILDHYWQGIKQTPVANNNSLYIKTDNCHNVVVDLTSNTISGWDFNGNSPISHTLGLVDLDNDPIEVFQGQLWNIRGCSNNGNNHAQLSINPSNNIITFTPRTNFFGRAQFSFHLYDGTERGSFVLITIDIDKDANCFNNDCELIMNGGLEEGMEYNSWTGTSYDIRTDAEGTIFQNHIWQHNHHFIDGMSPVNYGWNDNVKALRTNFYCWDFWNNSNANPPLPLPPSIGAYTYPAANPVGGDNVHTHIASSLLFGNDFTEIVNLSLSSPMIIGAKYNLGYDFRIDGNTSNSSTMTNNFHFNNNFNHSQFVTSISPNSNMYSDVFVPSGLAWYTRSFDFVYNGSANNSFMSVYPSHYAGNHGIFMDKFSLKRVFDLTASFSSPCLPATLTITNSTLGGGSFTYSLNGGTPQISPVFNITSYGNYTITVSDGSSCTNITTSLGQIDCCLPSYPHPIFIDPSASDIYTYFNILPGSAIQQNFAIEGKLTVDVSTWFANNNVKMAENAEIALDNGTEFKCTDGAVLEGICDKMWKGITATQTGSLVSLSGGSTFRDMEQGVLVQTSGKLDATNCLFQDNLTSIALKDLPDTYNGRILNNVFSKVKPNLYAPWQSKTRGDHGITISNCLWVVIGDDYSTSFPPGNNIPSQTPGNGNHFENLHNGIHISNSLNTPGGITQIRTAYNMFNNIKGGPTPWASIISGLSIPYNEDWRGAAIYGMNTEPTYYIRLYHKGQISTTQDFIDCEQGIMTNAIKTEVFNSRLLKCDAGFVFHQTDDISYNINSNSIESTYLGIQFVGNTGSGFASNNSITKLKANPIYDPTFGTLVFYGKGIDAQFNNSATNNHYVSLGANRIETSHDIGVLGISIFKAKSGSATGNIINFNSTNATFDNSDIPTLRGIQLFKCENMEILENEVHGINNFNALNFRKTIGMYLFASPLNDYACNIFSNVQYGGYVVGDCNTGSFDKVNGNHFNTYIAGLLFKPQGGSEGTLGTIGNSPDWDANNKFYGINTLNTVYRYAICSGSNDQINTDMGNLSQIQSTSDNNNCNPYVVPPNLAFNYTYTACRNKALDPPTSDMIGEEGEGEGEGENREGPNAMSTGNSQGTRNLDKLLVYPNPTQSHVTFKLNSNSEEVGTYEITVYDLHGREVHSSRFDGESKTHTWNTQKMAAGTYIYKVKLGDKIESGKLIILK